MENENSSDFGSFLISRIPFKLKLGIILGIIIFFFIILIPVMITTGVFGSDETEEDDEETSETSESDSSSTIVSEIVLYQEGDLTFAQIGNQTVKTFCYPVTQFKTISATFGQSGSNWANGHTGVDFIGSSGCSVVAVADGTVYAVVQNNASYGNYVVIAHTYTVDSQTLTFYTQYCHMQNGSLVVNVGDTVSQGQKLGIMGATRKCYWSSLTS